MITTYRVRESDSTSVVEPQAAALFELPAPTAAPFWDLAPFAADIKTHKYTTAYRTNTAQTVTNTVAVATTDTVVTISTADRIVEGQVLYDPATKQSLVLGTLVSGSQYNIKSFHTQSGSARAIITVSSVLDVIAPAADYSGFNGYVQFETTVKEDNYVQDISTLLKFFRADLEEVRNWGVDKQRLLMETMTRTLRGINLSMYYGIPQENTSSVPGMTAGFDYLVRKAGGNYSKAGATDELSDLKAAFVAMRQIGMDGSDAPYMIGSVKAYEYFNSKGLATITTPTSTGSSFVQGNIMTGLNVAGFGFVPFLVDANLRDNHVRIAAQSAVQKAWYNGEGEEGTQSVLRLIDEPGLSTSKAPVSSLQGKFGTVIEANRCRLYTTAIV